MRKIGNTILVITGIVGILIYSGNFADENAKSDEGKAILFIFSLVIIFAVIKAITKNN